MTARLPTAVPAMKPAAQEIRALFRESPFAQPGEFHELTVQPGQSIAEIVAQVAKPWQQRYLRVVLRDEVIDPADWPLTVPKAGDTLNLLLVPGDSDVGAIFKAVAIIAVTIAVIAMMPASAPAWMVAAASAAAGLATSLALNAIFPPPMASLQSGTGSSGLSEDPVYGFSTVQNATNPYGAIPRVYGRRYIKPNHAMNPIVVCQGSQQYLYQAFTAGYGPLQIESICIGDTPIEHFNEVEIHVHEAFAAGDPLYLVDKDIWQDPHSIKLTQGAENIVASTDNAERLEIDFQFNQGLFWLNSDNGDYNVETVVFQVDIRPVGGGWMTVGEYGATVNGGSLSFNQITVSRKTQRPFFVTLGIDLPAAGKYEVRAKRLSEDRESREKNKSYDVVYLASVRSIRKVAPIIPDNPISLIEIKILATDQLNGTINNLSCIVTSKLPVYRNGAWSVEATRNPAWCYLDNLRGPATRRPIKDRRIVFSDIVEWAAWCDSAMPSSPGQPRAHCDMAITSQTTLWETLKQIAATGFAAPTTVGSRYSIAIDRPQSIPVQVFSPDNIKSLAGLITYHTQPHAFRVQYTPEDSDTAAEISVFDDGYSAEGANGTAAATEYEVLKLIGVTRQEQAYVHARRALAQGRLRIEQWTISLDAEHLLAGRGSFVRLSHPVPMIGSGSGRITALSGQTITLDSPIDMTGAAYVRVRRSDNTQLDLTASSYTTAAFTLVGNLSGIAVGDLVVYGNVNHVTEDCFVKSIRRGADLTAELVIVPVAAGIYTADTEPIPAYEAMLPPQTGGSSSGGSTGVGSASVTPGQVQSLQAGVFVTYNQGAPKISVSLSWSAPVTGRAVRYQVYHYWRGAWQLRSTVYDTTALAYSEFTFVDEAGQPVNMNGEAMLFAVVGVNGDGAALPPDLGTQITVTPQTDAPATVDTLATAGGAFCINVLWALQTNGFDAAHVEIWGSQTNNRSAATLLATPSVTATRWQMNGLSLAEKYYFWIRVVDGAGNQSDWYPTSATGGVAGQPRQDADYLLDQLDGAIGLDQLAAEIAQPISLIDPIKFKLDWELGNVNIQKLAEKAFNDNERVHSSAQVITEAAARADADEATAIMISEVSARLDTGDYAVVKETVEASASALQGVTARYLLQVDANGHVAAINLQSDEAASSMVFLADKFLMARPDGSGAQPMMQLAVVNGQTVLGLNGTLIGNDGIFIGKIVGGELVGTTGTFAGKLLAGVVDMTSLIGSSYTFGTPGWQTLYVPEGYTSMRVTALGAGGGGGSASYGEWNTTRARGGGGRAGAYVIQAWDNLAVGAAIGIYVGNAGLGATEWQQAGYNGEATFVNYNSTRLITAAGGAGGGFAEDYDNQNAAIATGRVPVNGLGIGGAPGLVGDGNYGSPVWTAGFNASGYGAGGGGGGNSGRQGAHAGGSPDKYNQWAGGGKGSGGRIIVEFYNPNAVVLRTEFTALQNRVAALEAR